MQPAAVDMARVGVTVLLACLACTVLPVLAQDPYEYYSGFGSGSGELAGDGSNPPVDQEQEVEDKFIAHYQEDPDFQLCERYPYSKKIF